MDVKRGEWDAAVTIRTNAEAVGAVDGLVARLKASRRLRFRGQKPTKEAVINALWLWAADMDFAHVEAAMSAYLPRLEALINGAGSARPDDEIVMEESGGVIVGVDARVEREESKGKRKRG